MTGTSPAELNPALAVQEWCHGCARFFQLVNVLLVKCVDACDASKICGNPETGLTGLQRQKSFGLFRNWLGSEILHRPLTARLSWQLRLFCAQQNDFVEKPLQQEPA